MEPKWLTIEQIKKNSIGKIIEDDTPAWVFEPKEGYYHAVTRDWVSNEIFRRVDPKKRTMGEFLREEMPQYNIHCAVKDETVFDYKFHGPCQLLYDFA